MLGQTNRRILSSKLQRTLRKEMTDAERVLWSVLRARQLGGHKFRRQHPFGDYILDFVCVERKLVIEVDGGQHLEQVTRDEVRTQGLMAAGFRVLRFWSNDVLQETEAVKERIWTALQDGQPSGQPQPLPDPTLSPPSPQAPLPEGEGIEGKGLFVGEGGVR